MLRQHTLRLRAFLPPSISVGRPGWRLRRVGPATGAATPGPRSPPFDWTPTITPPIARGGAGLRLEHYQGLVAVPDLLQRSLVHASAAAHHLFGRSSNFGLADGYVGAKVILDGGELRRLRPPAVSACTERPRRHAPRQRYRLCDRSWRTPQQSFARMRRAPSSVSQQPLDSADVGQHSAFGCFVEHAL